MNRTGWSFVLVGALVFSGACEMNPTAVAAPAPASAPREARLGDPGARILRVTNPIAPLLAMRDSLGLTAEQVSRLQRIQAELRTKNQPLLQQLRAAASVPGADVQALKGLTPAERRARLRELQEARRTELASMTPEERRALGAKRQARLAELKPTMQEVRTNVRTAVERAKAVLTSEQQAKFQARRKARVAQARERARSEGRGAGRRGPSH